MTELSKFRSAKFFKNSDGSALILVLILMAAIMATTGAVLSQTASLSQTYSQKASAQVADNVIQLMSSIIADPAVCRDGFDGVTATERGLYFVNAANVEQPFNIGIANGLGQDISLPSQFTVAGVIERFDRGFPIPGADLTIQRLFVNNAQPVALPAINTFSMDLNVQFTSTKTGINRGLNVRRIMRLRIITNGAGAITDCGVDPSQDSNQNLCEGMNCEYSTDAGGKSSCFCPVQPITCPAGQHIRMPITGLTPTCDTAIVERTCPANSYLVALDNGGNAMCANVMTCPAGTSGMGPGGPANPPECRCSIPGQVWSSALFMCGFPTPPGCGTSNLQTLPSAPTTGLCSAGSPSGVSGTGPWTWTCTDAFGGGTINCSASLACSGGATTTGTGAAATPAGCFCPAGQNWNGTTCFVPPPVCTGGALIGGTGGAATPAGCFCPAGQSWNGANCFVAAPICTGGALIGGTGGPATPAGCSCPAGQNWNGANCVIAPPLCSGGALIGGTGGAATPAGCSCPAGQTWNGTSCSSAAAMCPDGVTPKYLRWIANMGSPSTPCSPYYDPSPPAGYTGSDGCNHMPEGTICTASGFQQTCSSTCSGGGPTCTGGATSTVTASPATPAGCYCPAGQTWNGSVCSVPLSCTGGATTTASAAPATPAGCYCQGGLTWDGASCVTGGGGACNPGPTETLHKGVDGFKPMCAYPDCIGKNYMSPAYGGTGMYENFASCTTGTAGQTCVSRVVFSSGNNCNESFQCLVYTKVCGAATANPCATPGNCRYKIGSPEDTGTAMTICGSIDGSPCTGVGGFGAITGCVLAVGGARHEVTCVP